MTAMAEFCIHEKHGGICEKVGTYCNLGACPDEDLEEYAPVRHGRWIEHKHFNHDHYIDSTYECSECNVEEPLTSDYCPNCGAKMGGGADCWKK